MLYIPLFMALTGVFNLNSGMNGFNSSKHFEYQCLANTYVFNENTGRMIDVQVLSTFNARLNYNDVNDYEFYLYSVTCDVTFDDDDTYYESWPSVTISLNNYDVSDAQADYFIHLSFNFTDEELAVVYFEPSLGYDVLGQTIFDEDYSTMDITFSMQWYGTFATDIPNSIVSDNSYSYGVEVGYQDGYNDGVSDGIQQGYQDGYDAAVQDLADYDQTALTIFTGIVSVGLLPVNVFLQILNFEVFGINIGAFVSSLITVAIIVIVIRMVTGNSGGGKKE